MRSLSPRGIGAIPAPFCCTRPKGRATVKEVLDELFGAEEAIKLVLTANLSYFHDDPAQMPFLRFAIPQASYLRGGGHYIRGGSQALSDRLVALVREAKGVVETS